MSEFKQTAVEYLNEQLSTLFRERREDLIDAETFYKQKIDIFQIAVEMEKNQFLETIKRFIKEEYKRNKKLYDDKEEPVIGVRDGKLIFYDGDFHKTNSIE